MNPILTGAFALFFLSATAQTPLIAHKSHSGTPDSYFVSASSNFGDNPAFRAPFRNEQFISIDQNTFIPLDDSTMVVELRDFEQKLIKSDTLPNKNRYSTTLFKLKYQDSIRKEQLKIYEEELRKEEELMQREDEKQKLLESQQRQQLLNHQDEPKPTKKKSYLLFLFSITGGGILLTRLLSQSKSNQ